MKKTSLFATTIAVSAAMLGTLACPVFANDGRGLDAVPNVYLYNIDYDVIVGANGANVRTAPSMDADIITTFNPGEQVEIFGNVYTNSQADTGWREVYVEASNGGITEGFVNDCTFANSNDDSPAATGPMMTVTDVQNYLALRSAQSYDDANEIAQLHNGDQVEVLNQSGTYWQVYAPSLGITGYVNHYKLA